MVAFNDKPIHDFPTSTEWESFLSDAPPVTGVRLRLLKNNAPPDLPGLTKLEAVESALCYGWIDSQGKSLDDHHSLVAFTPRRKASMWSQINRDHVNRLVAEGRMTAAGLAEVERAKADGRWDAAYRQKDAQVPADFQAALDANPAALAFFDTLSKTARFTFLFRLGRMKRPAMREQRIGEYVTMLAARQTL